MPNIWDEFFFLLGCQIPDDWESYLFPRAVCMPGWKHVWDCVVQRSLSSLNWFGWWVLRVKALCSFMRLESTQEVFGKHLRHLGLAGAAELIETF